MNLLIGADPEFFLYHEKHGNISAHDIVPGTKEDPHKLDKGAVQADGTAVEFNIDPASNAQEFHENIMTVLQQIRKMIDPKLKFNISPSVRYEAEYFQTIPELSRELGCTPDFNAYSGEANPKPDNYSTMRTGAGHIHVGFCKDKDPFEDSHLSDCREVVKNLDNVYLSLEKVFDNDDTRRKMYGAAGAFRPKHYGVEYRVPSNAWLKYPALHKWMFTMTSNVISDMVAGRKATQVHHFDYMLKQSGVKGAWNIPMTL